MVDALFRCTHVLEKAIDSLEAVGGVGLPDGSDTRRIFISADSAALTHSRNHYDEINREE